ncbi:MAG: hypothetical protein DLM71_07380 [Chloroflexi bacterium]|nr:MAG: hypothetical protein DLM71_07380 [Chloroflexota bacterium]
MRPFRQSRVATLVVGAVFVAFSLGSVGTSWQLAAAAASPSAITALAVADAYIQKSKPSTNAGSASSLQVDNSPVKNFLVGFTLTGIGLGTVDSARLRLYATDPSRVGGTFTLTATAWSESSVTWNNAPAGTTTVGTLGAVATGGWYELDVTSAVRADGTYSFRASSTSADGANYASREDTQGRGPQLVVTFTPPPAPTPSPTPTPTTTASPTLSPTPTPPGSTPAPTPPNRAEPVIMAAGDISCDPADPSYRGGLGTTTTCQQAATANLIAAESPNAVLLLGDNQYETGSLANFNAAFAPTWGRFLGVTKPAPGNHEYGTPGAAGYYDYFGALAGDPTKGYYSYDIGTWHIVAVNSNCSAIGGCGAGSAQEQWLKADLAAHPAECIAAYWHHPRFTSGEHGNATFMQAIWADLYTAGADVVLNGHDHDYERFAPQDALGTADPSGIREFVVGTGGKSHYGFLTSQANSEVRDTGTFGALKLTLGAGRYDWQFLPVSGATFTDSGTASCGSSTDTSPPSVPSGLTATASSPTAVDLSWSASTDNVAVTGYEIDRDGQPIATVVGTALTYTDTTARAATTYSYTVRARDAARNWSAFSAPAPVTTPASAAANAVFSDDFELGSMTNWTSSGTSGKWTVQGARVHAGSFAAQAITTTGAAYAKRNLSVAVATGYFRSYIYLASGSSAEVKLMRLRTAADVSLLTLSVLNGKLRLCRDYPTPCATVADSATAFTSDAWHSLEIRLSVSGAGSSADVWLDGSLVAFNPPLTGDWGTTPIGKLQIGEVATGGSWNVTYDDVVFDTSRIGP